MTKKVVNITGMFGEKAPHTMRITLECDHGYTKKELLDQEAAEKLRQLCVAYLNGEAYDLHKVWGVEDD